MHFRVETTELSSLHVNLAGYYIQQGDFRHAINLLVRAKKHYPTHSKHLDIHLGTTYEKLARHYLEIDEYSQAISAFHQAIEFNPDLRDKLRLP